MAKASSEIGLNEAAAVSAVVSTIVTAATASASAAVRVASSSASAAPALVTVTAAPQLYPRQSTAAAAAGCGIESIGRGSEGSVVDNAAGGLDNPRGNVQWGENSDGGGQSRRLEPSMSRGSKCFIKDEEKGGQSRGTAQVVYSRGSEDGEAIWVAGRRQAAAVKVRPLAPECTTVVALPQGSQLRIYKPSYDTRDCCSPETTQARHLSLIHI